MKTTVDAGGGSGYGLGPSSLTPGTGGVTLWVHIGRVPGSYTGAGATADGSRSTVINFNADWDPLAHASGVTHGRGRGTGREYTIPGAG
ncbi:hypothetical protein ACWEPM_17110 [Streptomyces sp. NPDC004244]